jgi:GT2 family glycosyltransferase
VVVDNGSRSSEADEIEGSGLATAVVPNRENLGFAGGSNVGIRYALEHGADYICLLKNDTRVGPDCLTTLLRTGETEDRVGLLSPVIYDHASPQPVKFTGTIVDFDRQDRTHLTSTEDMARAAHADDLALWGTALLIKRRVAEQVGLLAERYFPYVEDMDSSIRAVKAGFAMRWYEAPRYTTRRARRSAASNPR